MPTDCPSPFLDLLRQARSDNERGQWQSSQQGLIGAAGLLRSRALQLDGALRQQHEELARRLSQQAEGIARRLTAQVGLDAPPPPALPDAADTVEVGPEARRLLRLRYEWPLRHPALARRFGQAAQGGVLLYGPPGTGQTHLVRTLAASLGVPVFNVAPAQLLSKWLGDSEKQLAALFEEARRTPAALMFIDEIDALAVNRDEAGESSGPMQRLLSQLLAELDGFRRQTSQLMFIGATNRPWALDAALLRPGRFDALQYLGLPGQPARTRLLQQALKDVPQAPGLPWADAAQRLQGCTVAEVRACALDAARLAFEDAVQGQSQRCVSAHDLDQAVSRTPRSVQARSLARYADFARDRGLPLPGEEAPPAAPPAAQPPPAITAGPAEPFEPLRFVRAHDLDVTLDLLPHLSYALQHAGHGPVRQITVHNRGAEESQNLLLEVSLVPHDWGEPYSINLARLGAGEDWCSGPISLPLRLERLRQVSEKEHAHLRITLRDKDEVLLARTHALPVLAYNEWIYLPGFLELTAAYVQPNSPALAPVLQAAALHLQKSTGSAAFSGYQAGQRSHVRQMLEALHRALGADMKLGYINPPPSFEHSGQKVRLVADTLAQGRGTCLDLALLQCALWERIGLNPLLLLIPGHALMAVWLDERAQARAVTRLAPGARDAAAREIAQALSDGALMLVNSTEITSGHTLAQAERQGQALVQQTLDAGHAVEWVDIHACRSQVTPLP